MKTYDIILIGTGQATGTILPELLKKKLKIAVIESDRTGGTCVNWGCTPTKTLVASAFIGQPKLILLDEPTAGINPTLIRQLVKIIRGLKERGIQIFLIEHNMPLVAEICEKIFVMDSGSLIFSGLPSEARRNVRVIEAYLGREDRAA